jgi:hypothetical protein
VYTGVDGRFTTAPLGRGNHVVRARHTEHPSVEVGGVAAGGTVTLRMPDGATVAGAVTREGLPVVDFALIARPSDGDRELHQRGDQFIDAGGHFELGGLERGEYELTARDRANGVGSLRVRLERGEAKRGLTIALSPEPNQ